MDRVSGGQQLRRGRSSVRADVAAPRCPSRVRFESVRGYTMACWRDPKDSSRQLRRFLHQAAGSGHIDRGTNHARARAGRDGEANGRIQVGVPADDVSLEMKGIA